MLNPRVNAMIISNRCMDTGIIQITGYSRRFILLALLPVKINTPIVIALIIRSMMISAVRLPNLGPIGYASNKKRVNGERSKSTPIIIDKNTYPIPIDNLSQYLL